MKDKEEEMKKKEEMLGKAEEEKTALQEALDAANEVLAGYKQKEEEMAKKEKMMKRMASLIEAGLDNDAASAAVEKFDSIDDDSFDAFTSLLAAMKPAKKKVEEEKEEASEETTEVSSDVEEKAEEESVADASDLENVEVEPEVSLAVSDEEEAPAIETTRAALVDFVKSRLQTK
jgi:hypothetical protein